MSPASLVLFEFRVRFFRWFIIWFDRNKPQGFSRRTEAKKIYTSKSRGHSKAGRNGSFAIVDEARASGACEGEEKRQSGLQRAIRDHLKLAKRSQTADGI
ncbi:hypothetical protein sr17282 [Sporisorium reilianum SRZ2]|uniref:Uncharacterized protein n=1 Tax=Sporisorium reilianum (strain SRZ2) TaxID=999809 RepID=E7A2L2_SPORE|nr:hypothetical protein sr17282 [Sporisorium reilianum SRZ2]